MAATGVGFRIFRKVLTSCLGAIPRNEVIKRGLFSLAIEEKIERYEQVFSMLPSSLIDGLFHTDILPNDTQERVLSVWREVEPFIRQTDELGGFSFMEMRYFLPDELLMYGDKISMAHSLEVRVPCLNQSIVKYVLCLLAIIRFISLQGNGCTAVFARISCRNM